jgi:hypothetical protein
VIRQASQQRLRLLHFFVQKTSRFGWKPNYSIPFIPRTGKKDTRRKKPRCTSFQSKRERKAGVARRLVLAPRVARQRGDWRWCPVATLDVTSVGCSFVESTQTESCFIACAIQFAKIGDGFANTFAIKGGNNVYA